MEYEGFICPYCLVGFGSSAKLQGHFVDMHSGQGLVDDYDLVEDIDDDSVSSVQSVPSPSALGHQFQVVRQSRPKTCDSCNEIVWHDGLVCQVCQVTVHVENCQAKLTVKCTGDSVFESSSVEAVEEPERPQSPPPGQQTAKGILPLVRRQVAKPSLPLPLASSPSLSSAPLPPSYLPLSGITKTPTSSPLMPRTPSSTPLQEGNAMKSYDYPKKIDMGRGRYVNDEFDLDLTYITERIIAMSFPASGVESAYRNNLKDVARMLKTKHEDNYMIFNLSERSYDISRFNNQVLDFGWPDHLAPSLERLSSVCKSIKSWLDSEPLHVAVVHCKGGKGRTGCVIAAFMHYTEICHSAAAALDRFAMKRFYDNKMGGVTQPSQKKYVHYFSDLLAGNIDLQAPPVVLQHVLLHGIPNFDGKGGCKAFLKIYVDMKLVYTSALFFCTSDKERIKISIYGGLVLQGEVLLKCFHKKTSGMDSIFRCQFPSAVVKDELRLVYKKADLDVAFKDKRFGEHIKVELIFGEGDEANGISKEVADVRTSLLDAKQPGHMNGSSDLSHDRLATRDSYISFAGGFNNGLPEEEVPDLMGHESPVMPTKHDAPEMKRDRTESSTSFNMDPEDIERVRHHSHVYTVVNKSFKATERERASERVRGLKITAHKSASSVLDGPSSKSPDGDSKSYKSTSNILDHANAQGGGKPRFTPSRPPPPNVLRKQVSADGILNSLSSKPVPGGGRPPPSLPPPRPPSVPLSTIPDHDYADYAEVEEPPLTPSSSADNSPFHQPGGGAGGGTPVQIKQVGGAHHNRNSLDGEKILVDVKSPAPKNSDPQPKPRQGPISPSHRPPNLGQGPQAQKGPDRSKKPVPAARPSNHQLLKPTTPADVARENKKLELHQKYSKIRDEMLRKQGNPPEASDQPRGGVAARDNHADLPFSQGGPKKRPHHPRDHPTPQPRTNSPPSPPEGGSGDKRSPPSKNTRSKPPKGFKSRHRPSYTEVEPDFEITVEPVPNRISTDDSDNNMWMKVKYPTMPKRMESTKRSSSSSNLTGSDYYSNLAELQLDAQGGGASEGSGSDSLGRRRHSFSEGEDRLIIRASTASRESVIDISNRALSDNQLDAKEAMIKSDPDYKNLYYNEDGNLSFDPTESFDPAQRENSEVATSSFNQQIKILGNIVASSAGGPRKYENTRVPNVVPEGAGDDYMNDFPEGIDHTYSNQDELLQQMQAENQPLPEEAEKATTPSDVSQRGRIGSGASILKFFKNSILKPRPHAEIHSSSIPEGQQDKTLAPFAMSGVSISKVNRDYEAFLTPSAWGSVPQSAKKTPVSPAASSVGEGLSSSSSGGVASSEQPALGGNPRATERERFTGGKVRPLPPPSKPRSRTSGDVLSDSKGAGQRPGQQHQLSHSPQNPRAHPLGQQQQQQQQQQQPPQPPLKRALVPPTPAERPHSHSGHPKLVHSITTSPPSPPTNPAMQHPPPVRPHQRLQASNSDAPVLPKPRLRDTDRAQSIEPPNSARNRRGPPPVPPPPFPQPSSSMESQVLALKPYWYKPKISREEAIELVLPMSTGSFIVRDSSTVKGGYALTLKITEAIVRMRKKLSPDDKVTEDMLVTHFLIQPDPVGVKLQGWSEKPFKSLPAFIASHVTEKMCLPCKLVLPSDGGTARRQPAGVSKAMQSGAACDLVYLGSVDVPSSGSDSLLTETVQQLQNLDLSTMNIVTITVSREGVTLQENNNGSYLKRQYPYNLITYCGLDPVTRWNFPNLQHLGETVSLSDRICFGIVHRPVSSYGYSCMVFAEYDSSQPVSSVVKFIQKMMREHKHSSKYGRS